MQWAGQGQSDSVLGDLPPELLAFRLEERIARTHRLSQGQHAQALSRLIVVLSDVSAYGSKWR